MIAPRAYPAQWESDVVFRDGGTAHVRPIRPDDAPRLARLFDRLSPDSVYFRFLSPLSTLSDAQLQHFATVDYQDRMALVALLGDEIVAVARYDRLADRDQAEVAFTVDDEHQGRGVATMLLEHLAAVARASGIRRFWASTLQSNARMLDVFRESGFEEREGASDEVVEVVFPIDATDHFRDASERREHLAEARSTARLLAPGSIAVVGAGRRPGSVGHELLRNLVSGGFTGALAAVNRAASPVAGVPAYDTLAAIPHDVDLAIIAVPARDVHDIVQACATKHVRGVVVISSGFAELGGRGADAEAELVRLCRGNGLRLVGPNCMGLVNTNPAIRMNATFAPVTPQPGRVGFSSQSGAVGIEVLAHAQQLGFGVSTFVSVGNRADVSSNDLLQYWEDDPDTDVVLLYLESFGNPRKFARIATRISMRKPIVAVKSGRTPAGSRGASSHTAALASTDVVADALFQQTGVIRVDTLEQLFDAARVLAHQPIPAGRRVAIVSNGGGPGILAADACESAGLQVPELPETDQTALRAITANDAAVRNPIDLVASATAQHFSAALRVVLESDAVDAVLAIFTPPLASGIGDVPAAIAAAAAATPEVPLVATLLAAHEPRTELPVPGTSRVVPTFGFPERAAHALGRVAQYADWRRRPRGTVPSLPRFDHARAEAVARRGLAERGPGSWLDADEAAALCSVAGITVAPVRRVMNPEDALAAADAIGYPVALKAAGGAYVHKTDRGLVAIALESPDALRAAFDEMRPRLDGNDDALVVQSMIDPGVELIAGITQDQVFGPLVLLGLGGVTAELLRDRALSVVPITDVDARELVRSLRGSPLLFGYRGSEPVDVAGLEDLVLRIGALAEHVTEIAELDCNPVVASSRGIVAVDIKVRVADPGTRIEEVRRLG